MSLGERVRELREKDGISQVELAEDVGVTPAFICYVERGQKKPSIDVVSRMAEFFGTSTDYIVRGKEVS